MNTHFYKVWLPVSLVGHLLLVLVLGLITFNTPHAEAENLTPITVVDALPEVEPQQPVKATPPPPARITSVATKVGVPKPKLKHGKAPTEGKNTLPGPGKTTTAPPDVMKTKISKTWTAPQGHDNGIGTQGKDLAGEPSGPGYPAAAQGGPNPGYPKLAQEEGQEGSVVVRVNISSQGAVEDIEVIRGDYPLLNSAAERAARAWRYTPAVENGKPVKGTVKLQFTFKGGHVEGVSL